MDEIDKKPKMRKVYVVTDGSYSSYHIIGVFSTLKKAKICKESYNAENDIETYELDAGNYDPYVHGYLFWVVNISENETSVYKESMYDYNGNLEKERISVMFESEKEVRFFVYAKSENQAIKIAADRWAQLVASGEVRKYYADGKKYFYKILGEFDLTSLEATN